MRIKKYIASTLQEGKAKIFDELGEDAVILSSRTFKNPEDLTKDIVEIVAALDDSPIQQPVKKLSVPLNEKKNDIHYTSQRDNKDSINDKTSLRIYEEFEGIKYLLGKIDENVRFKYSGSLSPVLGQIFNVLRKADIPEEFALTITGNISAHSKSLDYQEALKKARELVVEHIQILPPLKKTGKRIICAFIGTTGSGKTASLVKLAIICKLIMDSNVLLVSADSQKVGGHEQLQTYASIAGISFDSVYSPNELKNIISEEKSRDFIFIDTTGGSQNNQAHIREISTYLNAASADYVFLVQSSGTSESTFKQIVENYNFLKPNALIISKFDECGTIGTFISAMRNVKIPVMYFTNGQKIPDDIEPASREKLGEIVLNQ